MFHAKKLLLCLVVGWVLMGAENSVRAADAEGKAAGYLTKAGTIWVNKTFGVALIMPPWDPHRLHKFRIRYVSSSAHVWWYRVPGRQIYLALDHSGHSWCEALVWIYYRDGNGHGHWHYYPAKVTELADGQANGSMGSERDDGADAAEPRPEDALPEPEMSEPDNGGPDTLPPPDFRLFPDDPAPGTGGDDNSTAPDDFFQPPSSSTPPENSTPPFSSDLFPRVSP